VGQEERQAEIALSRDDDAEDHKETGRIEAFSDGVFAIAITLLVLDLHLPSDGPAESESAFFAALGNLWPNYLAFLTSFAFIGIMWINHHRLFMQISRSNTWLQICNLLLLLGVTVVPFPTSMLAVQLREPDTLPARDAALVYSAMFVAIAVFFNLLWRYAATGNRLLDRNADRQAVERISRQYLLGPLGYGLAFGLAFVNIWASLLLNLLLALFFALPGPPLTPPPPQQRT
jgi:uncharacterized membrane protein